MKPFFTFTAEHRIEGAACSLNWNDLPGMIRKHTDWSYSCKQTDTGCLLKPVFRKTPYRNSFVPEIEVTVLRDHSHTVLCLRGRPVLSVRIFMTLWLSIVSLAQLSLLAAAVTSNLESLAVVFVPSIMGVFGYLMCKICTGVTFRSVSNAIAEEINHIVT